VAKQRKKKQIKREWSNSLCKGCPSICCTDLAIHTTKPRTKDEIFEMKWHLQYDTVSVCIRNLRWFLVVKGSCIYLDPKNRCCTIYDKRPDRCRRQKTKEKEITYFPLPLIPYPRITLPKIRLAPAGLRKAEGEIEI